MNIISIILGICCIIISILPFIFKEKSFIIFGIDSKNLKYNESMKLLGWYCMGGIIISFFFGGVYLIINGVGIYFN